ncbi:YbaN family protein [Aestuariibius sp. HNIBRBA575]|uniref:YbaN family protein n=1 Tax=Aestuariibius sp. HNIBRBA575 TaxID=3233343 RepID=UPI0034A51FEB
MSETPNSHSATTRAIWWVIGWAALILGGIGVLLPVLPTTPFMILAAFAFAKGSPRMRQWLLDHHMFGDPIRDWEQSGSIAPRYKAIATGLMAVTFVTSAALGLPGFVLIIQAVCMGSAALFVLSRPNS